MIQNSTETCYTFLNKYEFSLPSVYLSTPPEGSGQPDLYHYTTKEGAEAIQASGVIKPDDRGRVFVTTDQISGGDVNNELLMGQKPNVGTHVVEITLKDKNDF